MSSSRQQILILHLEHSDLASRTVAWALYDGASEQEMNTGDSNTPPYASVLSAMRDGWRVFQIPRLPYFFNGYEHQTEHLLYEYALERNVIVNE